MRGKFLICSVILIFSLTPSSRAAKETIFKVEENQSVNDKNRLVEELLKKCFVDEQKFAVIAGEGIDEKLMSDFHRSEETAIVSITSSKLSADDSYSRSLQEKNVYGMENQFRFQWKSSGFLISSYSPSNLKEIFDQIKYSRYWNSTGRFLLTEDTNNAAAPVSATRCSNAYDFLSLAWNYNVLDAVFLCQEVDENFTMYSFDPYGHNSAPSPWVKVREVKGRRGHPASLFKWMTYDGIRECSCAESELFFEKRKSSLNGYPILVNAVKSTPFLFFDGNETVEGAKYRGEDGWTMTAIWDTINATLVTVPLPATEAMIGWIEANGTVQGNLLEITSGNVDMGLNSLTAAYLHAKTASSYPHTTLNVCYVTKDRGAIPWLIGLIYVCDKWTMLCGCAVFLIAVVTFGYIDNRRFIAGCLNATRVFLSTSYVLPSSVIQPRVMICFLILLPLVSYSTYQGKVLSLIRNPSHYANTETVEELAGQGFRLEAPETLLHFFIPSELIGNYHRVNKSGECVRKLQNSTEPLVCADLCLNLIVEASRNKKIYLASDQSVHYPTRYVARPEFPIIGRFEEILKRIVEAGLLEHYREKSFMEKIDRESLPNDDTTASNDATDVMDLGLDDFYYIFVGLGIGWLCASLAFVVELIVGRFKKPHETTLTNPEGISPVLTAKSYQIIRRISRRENWPGHF